MKKIKFKAKRLIFIATTIALTSISVAIIITNFKSNIVFFYSPTQIDDHNLANEILDKTIRVGGMVKINSVVKNDALNSTFEITDYHHNLKIKYSGILPDLFREEQGVVAKGKFNFDERIFIADELLVKHDENYMPPEVAKDLKMRVGKE